MDEPSIRHEPETERAAPGPTVVIDFAERFPPEVLAEYLELRSWWYGARHRIDVHAPPDDTFDATSTIVLASDGVRCIGGVRASVAGPDEVRPLPMEVMCPSLKLVDLFPKLPLGTAPYAEFSRLVVASRNGAISYRNRVADGLFRFLWGPSNPRPDVRYAFSLAPVAASRIYRALADAHGLRWEARPVLPELMPASLEPVGRFVIQAYHLDSEGQRS